MGKKRRLMSARNKFKNKHASHPRMKWISAQLEEEQKPPNKEAKRVPEVVLATETTTPIIASTPDPSAYVEFTAPAPTVEPEVEIETAAEVIAPVAEEIPVIKEITKSAPKKRATTRKRTRKTAKTKTRSTSA